jgi:hypothetical protein
MSEIKLLQYVRFGDLAPGVRFCWGQWLTGILPARGGPFTRMKGNRYKDAEGQTFCTGMGTAVEIISEGSKENDNTE